MVDIPQARHVDSILYFDTEAKWKMKIFNAIKRARERGKNYALIIFERHEYKSFDKTVTTSRFIDFKFQLDDLGYKVSVSDVPQGYCLALYWSLHE